MIVPPTFAVGVLESPRVIWPARTVEPASMFRIEPATLFATRRVPPNVLIELRRSTVPPFKVRPVPVVSTIKLVLVRFAAVSATA